MIYEIIPPMNPSEYSTVIMIPSESKCAPYNGFTHGYPAWESYEMLENAGLSSNVIVGCYGGYENCLEFLPSLN